MGRGNIRTSVESTGSRSASHKCVVAFIEYLLPRLLCTIPNSPSVLASFAAALRRYVNAPPRQLVQLHAKSDLTATPTMTSRPPLSRKEARLRWGRETRLPALAPTCAKRSHAPLRTSSAAQLSASNRACRSCPIRPGHKKSETEAPKKCLMPLADAAGPPAAKRPIFDRRGSMHRCDD